FNAQRQAEINELGRQVDELKLAVRSRDRQIAELLSQLDKYQSVFHSRHRQPGGAAFSVAVAASARRSEATHQRHGISAEPQSEAALATMSSRVKSFSKTKGPGLALTSIWIGSISTPAECRAAVPDSRHPARATGQPVDQQRADFYRQTRSYLAADPISIADLLGGLRARSSQPPAASATAPSRTAPAGLDVGAASRLTWRAHFKKAHRDSLHWCGTATTPGSWTQASGGGPRTPHLSVARAVL
uniref:PKcGMP_CC domain-containing protein n=1 Tax=Macrostomum lignano TaxID=282301 RepID=A0A1I8F4F5_9PLAT